MDTVKKDGKKSPLKDKPLRYPGQSLDEEINRLGIYIVLYVVASAVIALLAFYEWWHWYYHIPPEPMITIVIASIAILYSIVKLRQINKRLKFLRLGRDGERAVGQSLEELRQKGCAIFHDIVGKDFNIDHVVVSPQGIFAVETKTYSKPARGNPPVAFDGEKVLIPGKQPDQKTIQQAIANAGWLSRDILKKSTGKLFAVMPVLVFPGWWVDESNNSKRIWVLNPERLVVKISEETHSLSWEDVHLAAFHLSRYVRG